MLKERDNKLITDIDYVCNIDRPLYEGGKGGSEEAHTPVETPNNLLSVAYAKVLIAVGEGEFAGNPTGRDIFLNGTPLLNANGEPNFGGVTWEWRSGRQDQTYIQGNPEVSNEISVGVEVTNLNPWVQQISKASLSAARVTLAFPALQQQLENGDTVGYTIDYAIDLSTDGGPFALYQTYQVSGKTNSTYERTHTVTLPESDNGWTIRVRRITINSESSLIQDTMNLKSYTEVIDAKQRYPNTALLFVQFDSRLFGGGSIPKISVNTEGRIIRIPSNYDPETRTYTGAWDGSFKWGWSDNPAWVFLDIVTQDRFGLGSRINVNNVDKWELYEVSQYCDVLVNKGDGSTNKQPRHTCNMYIQSKADAWEVLRDICSIFNGMTYWDGNQFVAIADKLEPTINIPLFNRSNVIDGEFNYTATDERTIFTSALVSYDEPTDHFNTQVEAVWEKSEILRWGGDRQTTLAAIGCTNRGEAQRKGKYTLLTNMFNRTVTFKTGLQGLDYKVKPGGIIGVADPLISGKPFTGRIKIATTTVVTLDRPTEAKAGDLLFITLKDGSQEARTVKQSSGNIVTVTTAYSEPLLPNATWYLEASDLKSQLFKVIKIASPEESIYEITATEYNESKYAAIDDGARLEPRPISKVPPQAQKKPEPVTITSNTFIEQTMAVTTMTIAYPQTENAVLYEGQWRIGQGDWVDLGTTGALEFNVRGVFTGKYLARVRAVNAIGIKSQWSLSATTDITGKAGAPPAITSLTVTPIVYGMILNWTFPNGAEDTARTEVMYSSTPNFADAIKLGDFAYPQQQVEMNGLAAGVTRFFWARLVDRSGNVGPYFPLTSENGVMGQSSNDPLEYEKYFLEQIKESALSKELNDRIDLIDGDGDGSVNDRVQQVQDELQAQIDSIVDLADSLPYDPTKTYTLGQAVLGEDGKLYQAKQDVPLTTPPPNTTYWTDVGQAVITADGLAARVTTVETTVTNQQGQIEAQSTRIDGVTASLNDKASVTSVNTLTGRVTEAEGKITANGQAITGVQSQINDPNTGLAANSNAISNLNTQVTILDGKVTSTSEKVDSVSAWVNSPSAGDESGSAGDARASAGATSIMSVIAERDFVLAQRTDEVIVELANSNARVTETITAQASVNNAQASKVSELIARTDNNAAAIRNEESARTNQYGSLANQISTVQAVANRADTTANQATASVQTVAEAQATTDGKVNATWAVKLQVNAQGQYVTAGVGLGIENGPAGLQSTFLVQADKFAVVNGVDANASAPFVVSGGQVFIKDAFIANGSITMLKIGDALQSDNYVAGSTGWRLLKNGQFEINGNVAGQGKMIMTNRSLRVYDGNNIKRVQLGDLSE